MPVHGLTADSEDAELLNFWSSLGLWAVPAAAAAVGVCQCWPCWVAVGATGSLSAAHVIWHDHAQ